MVGGGGEGGGVPPNSVKKKVRWVVFGGLPKSFFGEIFVCKMKKIPAMGKIHEVVSDSQTKTPLLSWQADMQKAYELATMYFLAQKN